MVKRYLLIVLIGAISLCAYAEDKKPAYQIADNSFFDPTRKQVQVEDYHFSVDYRIEVGYTQHWQHSANMSYADMYMHGVRLGATFTFDLPMRFGIQTGLFYTLIYGQNDQHWRSMDAPSVQEEYIRHRDLEHNLTVPVRLYYTIPVWQKLNLFVFTGPQLHIGLAENDYMLKHLSEGTEQWLKEQNIPTEPYDRFADELVRANIQWGVGGGIEWDKYRLQAGYDFGLNNLVRHNDNGKLHMWEWGWFVSFCYKF